MGCEERHDPDLCRFAFSSEGFEVEFHGDEEFVREQIERVGPKVLSILGGEERAAAGAEAKAEGDSEGLSPLEEFYRSARTRAGRGALQDSILVFANYMLERQKQREFSIEDLNFCFDLLGMERPKSLANTLGILKRDRNWLESGSKRGTYVLTTKGYEKARALLD